MRLHTVVIPCYKSSATIRKVVEETMGIFREMNRGGLEFVLVDDASPDQGATVSELRALAEDYENIRVIAGNDDCGKVSMKSLAHAIADVEGQLSEEDVFIVPYRLITPSVCGPRA